MAIKKGIFIGLAVYCVICMAGIATYMILSRNLPPLTVIERYKPPLATEILDRDGNPIYQFFIERRSYTPYPEIPEKMVQGFISIEDKKFFEHWGISVEDIVRAFLINLRARKVVQGASTITQQLARNMFLTQERTIKRKLREQILALKIETSFSKEEILEKYLNQIYFGNGVYGVKAASEFFFGKPLSELNLAEIAMICGIPRSPARYSPFINRERALRRQRSVLNSMLQDGIITQQEYEEALATPLFFRQESQAVERAPYFIEMVRQYVIERYGEDFLYKSGGKVYTTLDLRKQIIAEEIVDSLLQVYEERYDIEPKKADYDRDSTEMPPEYLQVAFVALEPATGEILALIGGRDFRDSEFNRVCQARRQPGSAFKPFVYTAAVDNGYSPAHIIPDVPLTLKGREGEETWYPMNFDERFLGPIPMRTALAKSRNLATVRLALAIEPVTVAQYARRMGIKSQIPPYPSLALGSLTLSLLELAGAYCTLANYGTAVEPYFIRKIVDSDGEVLEENKPVREKVLDSTTAYVVVNMLQSVLNEGTGISARTRYGFRRPAAGKTGTTTDYRDTWFIGFTPNLLAGAWVGFDSLWTITEGATGARFALPIWAIFMKRALEGEEVTEFPEPKGIVRAVVCEKTGLLATPECPMTREEIFIEGYAPKTYCTYHTSLGIDKVIREFDRREKEYILRKVRGG